jgi:lipopolysaccharide export system protein LptA
MNLPTKFFLAWRFMLHGALLGCLILTPALIQAKTADINQPLHIEADSVEIRERQGISIYKGNVSIRQGSMLIKGQLIHITSNSENNSYIIKIEGAPARFKQLTSDDQEVHAQSEKIIFSSATGILTMDKGAVLVQGKNKFTGEHIIYHSREDIVQAGMGKHTSDTDKPKRVSITIQPKAEKKPRHDQN